MRWISLISFVLFSIAVCLVLEGLDAAQSTARRWRGRSS